MAIIHSGTKKLTEKTEELRGKKKVDVDKLF